MLNFLWEYFWNQTLNFRDDFRLEELLIIYGILCKKFKVKQIAFGASCEELMAAITGLVSNTKSVSSKRTEERNKFVLKYVIKLIKQNILEQNPECARSADCAAGAVCVNSVCR